MCACCVYTRAARPRTTWTNLTIRLVSCVVLGGIVCVRLVWCVLVQGNDEPCHHTHTHSHEIRVLVCTFSDSTPIPTTVLTIAGVSAGRWWVGGWLRWMGGVNGVLQPNTLMLAMASKVRVCVRLDVKWASKRNNLLCLCVRAFVCEMRVFGWRSLCDL